MAARWGTGEEMIKVCNGQMCSTINIDEAEILQGSFAGGCLDYTSGVISSGDALEALHSCLDPSILSIFEDNPTEEISGDFDEESEATLLTALTEILDNVDDENLSPFDTLPDSDLLSGQKGQELSPLRKFFTRAPTESIHMRQFPGKRLSQQNSEGEEEEDGDASLIHIENVDLSSLDEFGWCFPVSLEQDGDSTPVNLSDLVKHMHPYCMTLCVEGDEGEEHFLPERGIVLEVIDKGEHGEPILGIPDLSHLLSQTKDEQCVPEKSTSKMKLENAQPGFEVSPKEVKGNVNKCCLQGKKCESIDPERKSSSSEELLQKKPQEEQKKKKVTFSPVVSTHSQIPKMTCSDGKAQAESKNTISQVFAGTRDSQLENKLPIHEEAVTVETDVCPQSETKPKSLSLEQYRLLRQQKKPDQVNETKDNSIKWPKLPEAPKELLPIPCLPEPSPRDPRRTFSAPARKETMPEIMPAWHPRGPAAPATPEALLFPPASMVASSKKPVTSGSSADSSLKDGLSSRKLPASTGMAQNTNQADMSRTPESAMSLTVSTTSQGSSSVQTPSPKECLHKTQSAAHVVDGNHTSSSHQPIKTTSSMPLVPSTVVPLTQENVRVKSSHPGISKKISGRSQPHVAPIASQPFFTTRVQAKVVKLAEQMKSSSSEISKPTTPVNLIEAFTSEIGIEAADLTSLLEQFEDSQSIDEQSGPEVSGRAAAVGNSSLELQVETKALERTRKHDLGSTAGLTPPATPPHQMWRPITPVALLEKTKKFEVTKPMTSKAIQIEPRPFPSNKLRSKTPVSGQTQPFSLDHDYCLLPKEPQPDIGTPWNVKQQPTFIIKSIALTSNKTSPQNFSNAPSEVSVTQKHLKTQRNEETSCSKNTLNSLVLATPDASPDRSRCTGSLLDEVKDNQKKSQSYESSRQRERGRSKRQYRARSSSRSESSSESSSGSRSPPRKRNRSRYSSSRSSSRSHSRSSSRSFSPPRRRRYSYSSSRSGSWSRSRSRSCSSDSRRPSNWKRCRSPNRRSGYHHSQNYTEDTKMRKEKAIEERRIVYVGRIHRCMTRKELKERFSFFGEIEECTVHFRENGDNYGFVTYYNTNDAFNAIENGSKLRKPNELPFDLCFGGRRQFCRSSYADLDSNREYEPISSKGKIDALDFDTLLKQAQKNLKR